MHAKQTIPVVRYPLNILLVDDDLDFLTYLTNTLSTNHNIQSTSSSNAALKMLKNKTVTKPQLFARSSDDGSISLMNSAEQLPSISFSLNNLLEIANDKNKYKDVGIIIADYDMPEINGIELCNRISPDIKKILLTGEYSSSEALQSFNRKEINCYLKKGDQGVFKEVELYIQQLTKDYFDDLSKPIIETAPINGLPFVCNGQFIDLFHEITFSHKIMEHYLIDHNGSFLLSDNKKERWMLLVHSEASLDEFCYTLASEKKVSHLVNNVAKREKLPFFGLNNDISKVSQDRWSNCFFAATACSDFYWSMIKL